MVGSHLTDFLIENTDWDIYGMARWRSPLDNIVHHSKLINSGQRLRLIYGDLTDDASLRVAIKESRPDYVFHLAAQSFPLTSFTAPIQTFETSIWSRTKGIYPYQRRHSFSSSIPLCNFESGNGLDR